MVVGLGRQAHTVVGMVHPSWTNSQANSQAFRGSIPPGCVWGTPLNPPPGWQASQANASKPGPLLGSAATNSSLPRYNSAPVRISSQLLSYLTFSSSSYSRTRSLFLDSFNFTSVIIAALYVAFNSHWCWISLVCVHTSASEFVQAHHP